MYRARVPPDMEHVEFVYTFGMDEAEIESHLDEEVAGVLALADGSRAYGVPVSHHYGDGSLYLRLSDDGDSEKMAFVETTTDACFTLFGTEGEDSWSVLARGELRPVDEAPEAARVNDWFDRFRVFDEAIEDVEVAVYELQIRELTGRKTGE